MSNLISITDAEFQKEVIDSSRPVVVDFWAPWCGPCRAVAPILEDLSTTMAAEVKIVKLNVDDNSQTASKFNVMNIPTLIVFKNGKEAERVVGALSKQDLEKKIRTAIS